MNETITHTGRITAVGTDNITVEINPRVEECNKCAISALCSKPQSVIVPIYEPSVSLIGSSVTIANAPRAHRLATVLFLIAPLVILLTVLCICDSLGCSQALAGTLSLSATALWFVVLLFFRKQLSSKSEFRIVNFSTENTAPTPI